MEGERNSLLALGEIYSEHATEVRAEADKIKAFTKILADVKARAISRNEAANAVKAKALRKDQMKRVKYSHSESRRDKARQDKRKRANIRRFGQAGRIPEDNYAEFRPKNKYSGWFSGNGYAVKERERLAFTGRCPKCNNTGKVRTSDKEQCVYPATNRLGWHMHRCKKPCTNCQDNHDYFNNGKDVYLKIPLTRNGIVYDRDAPCKLMGIKTKSQLNYFRGVPRATIKMEDGKTYVVNTTMLSTKNVAEEREESREQRRREGIPASNERRRLPAQRVNARNGASDEDLRL